MHTYTNPYPQHVCTHTQSQIHIYNMYARIRNSISTTYMHTYTHTHLQHVCTHTRIHIYNMSFRGSLTSCFGFVFEAAGYAIGAKFAEKVFSAAELCTLTHTHTHTHTFSAKICTQCQLTQTSPAFPLHGYGVVCVSWLWVQIFVRQETTWSW